ncbi:TetR/AcrR family transcriptional regulator [Ktedonosporobacter rubrisoli]|uniref:TetR/AcrR family transcriptional regulator n=1 Tax=Ktedonosporobacter rubrisoli TaxID=2509675 RepID=A0A4P6JTG4_KTERU|nr:TetR/AcrR family transcriptional regulator [Ktedonosporobacter rubrisoli]QBD78734.1 TetR/AcrR family transcriptional regulator [Ktedonosporobacter rubrisoli]
MKRSQQEKQQTHQRIVKNAAQQIRVEGVNGVGIADLMGQAGLTHGGFYAHFRNKDALLAEICHTGIAETLERLTQAIDNAPANEKISALLDAYLSVYHRDNPATGCIMPTLAADVARRPEEVRTAFTEGYEKLLQLVVSVLPEDTDEQRYDRAIALLSEMVGSLLLSRAVNDPALSERILRSNRDYAIQAFGKTSMENE